MKEMETIATVNGEPIYRAELEQEIRRMLTQLKQTIPPDQLQQYGAQIEQGARDNIINQKLLLQTAIDENITPETAVVDERLEQFISRFPSRDAYEKQIVSWGVTEDRIRADIIAELRISTILARQVEGLPEITDDEIQAFYDENPGNFQSQEKIRASHILITSTPDEAPAVRSEKRLRLAGIRGEVSRGTDFATLAGRHSDCPSKEKGGDLGFFTRGQMVKPFEETAFGMQPGDVSDIVETQFGYHLIQVNEREAAQKVDLTDDVKSQVEKFLRQNREAEIVAAYIESLREKATIEFAA